jgi:hypothetical protein
MAMLSGNSKELDRSGERGRFRRGGRPLVSEIIFRGVVVAVIGGFRGFRPDLVSALDKQLETDILA